MGEQTHIQIQTHEPPSQPHLTTITGGDTSLAADTSQSLSSSSKIPFRPRKIRKISGDSAPETTADTDGESKAITVRRETNKSRKRTHIQTPRVLPRIVRPLTYDGEIDLALQHLRNADPLLGTVIVAHPPPTFDSFHPPFLALTRSILYQQLAYKAGASIYTRFVSLCGGEAGVIPEAVLALSPHQLRQIGISGRKATYLHDLANKYKNGILSDTSIVEMDDKSLYTMLTMVKGIGSWSVHMFMIFSLHRPDVLPVADLSVRKGVQVLYGLEELPRPSQMDQLCDKWRPYRSVGAWYMWRLVEAKGAPPTVAATALIDGPVAQQQQQQQAQQHQLQLLDPINGIGNLGACIWGQ